MAWERTVTLWEQRWWPLLVPKEGRKGATLLEKHSDISPVRGDLIVCYTPLAVDHEPTDLRYFRSTGEPPKRWFTVFASFLHFAEYQRRHFQPTNRFFYEVILGSGPQKPHFDLEQDLPADPTHPPLEEVWSALVTTIVAVMAEHKINLQPERDILNFSSHGPTKRSYHVVIDNYAHADHKEAKALYDLVVARLPEAYRRFVDKAVYSDKQQFRLLGSQKVKEGQRSGRIKTLLTEWVYYAPPGAPSGAPSPSGSPPAPSPPQTITYTYLELPESPAHAELYQLEASLVGCTHNCILLPSFNRGTSPRGLDWDADRLRDDQPLSKATLQEAMRTLAEKSQLSLADLHYRMVASRGGLILLKRLRPSTCRLCQRLHEAENPYLMAVRNESGDKYHLYFHCRRAPPEQKLDLGWISSGELPKEIKTKHANPTQLAWAQKILAGRGVTIDTSPPPPDNYVERPASVGRVTAAVTPSEIVQEPEVGLTSVPTKAIEVVVPKPTVNPGAALDMLKNNLKVRTGKSAKMVKTWAGLSDDEKMEAYKLLVTNPHGSNIDALSDRQRSLRKLASHATETDKAQQLKLS